MIEESFAEAVDAFEEFLVSMGLGRTVCWVFREGTTSHRRRWLVHIDTTECGSQRSHSAALFEQGKARGLGMYFQALGSQAGITYAYIWLPGDEAEADGAMLSGRLRFSVPAHATIIRLTQRRWWFRVVRSWDRVRGKNGFLYQVPSKKE